MKKPEIIIALDVPNRVLLHQALGKLPRECAWIKIGLELFCAEGPAILDAVGDVPRKIFLDLKLHDIPRTVERAVEAIRNYPVSLLTLHASGGEAMLKAAVSAAAGSNLHLLAVTVLTSLDATDLHRQSIANTPGQQVENLAALALACGVHGVVASPREADAIRRQCGDDFLIVTPGIRPAQADVQDQKRVATPRDAVLAGASHLVIGRPILEAPDPGAAYLAIQQEIDAAVADRR
ncbi:MAG: orotidine-5'-phosphate decarboxylase [Verrucomicrobia bacterium]|nr:orotidine-5'-phosphate decarboxylase [Kiritimatiellia bacterium]MCP5487202.1 orotidine-5'-phosphate decarboxylase [Verrucomicrobiota bacterium]